MESDDGKKILFIHWLPCSSKEDDNQMKKSIKNFISASMKQITLLCKDVIKTIAFATTDWENCDQRKQLAEEIVNETIYQLKTEQFSNRSWKIIFVFNDEQIDFFNEFSQVMLSLQTEQDNDEYFFYPISSM